MNDGYVIPLSRLITGGLWATAACFLVAGWAVLLLTDGGEHLGTVVMLGITAVVATGLAAVGHLQCIATRALAVSRAMHATERERSAQIHAL